MLVHDCAQCPQMVQVAAGTFTMGSPDSEVGHDATEAPRHRVTIAKSFLLSRFEITFAQWDACVAAGGCGLYRPPDLHWGRGQRPVLLVSWNDANAYAAWLTRVTGRPYRLPTEAEWEYAARAGTTGPFSTGETIDTTHANYNGRFVYGTDPAGIYRARTLPIGSFAPNAFGLFDMSGNAAEWTQDCVHWNYDGAPSDGSAWLSGDCSERIVRGGSWASEPRLLRAAMRFSVDARERNVYTGFRVAAGP